MKRRRRGSIFLEACMAVAILAVALIAVAQLSAVVAHQQRAFERRQWATREAANLMERAMARPWAEVTAERLAALAKSISAETRLPGGRVAAELVEHEKPAAKEIRIRVEWLTKAGQPDRPVQLVAWKYRPEPERVP